MADDEPSMWGVTCQAPQLPDPAIVKPEIKEDTFEIKGQFINMVRDLQFDGRLIHNPFRHVESFLEICDLFKNKGATEDAIRLRVFPFSLTGEAKEWVKSLEAGAITTWALMRDAFINEFFPPAKADKIKIEITGFVQKPDESLTAAWERYKSLLRSCPTHKLKKEDQVKTFYRGISEESQAALDQSSGGVFMYKSATQAHKLLDDMAVHKRSWATSPREKVKMVKNEEREDSPILQKQVNDMSKKLEILTTSILALTEGKDNMPMMTEEEINFMNSQGYQRSGGFNNNYRGTSSGYNNQRQQNAPKNEPLHSDALEEVLKQFMLQTGKVTTDLQTGYLDFQQTQRNQQSAIQNLERDVGRLAKLLSERPQGGLPSNTQTNPKNKEQVNAIFTRSGIQVTPEKLIKPLDEVKKNMKESEKPKESDQLKETEKQKEKEISSTLKPGLYKTKIPFPQRLYKEKLKEKYSKFAELIKQVHINVPLVDLISGIPQYGKFLKELVSNKEKSKEINCVNLGEQCSALMTKIPPKLGDTGSFTIPCFLANEFLCNALADLGASINLMPLSLYSGLGLKDLVPTRMSIQLADRSVKYPLGIAENVPVKVGSLIFPVDFVVLDIKEDLKIPIILGRPFLNTADAIIHVNKKTLSLGIGKDRMTFSVDDELKKGPISDNACFSLDEIDVCVHNTLNLTFG